MWKYESVYFNPNNHDQYSENTSARFSEISKANASGFLVNTEEICYRFKYLSTLYCVTRVENVEALRKLSHCIVHRRLLVKTCV